MSYTISVLNTLASLGHSIHVIHWNGVNENYTNSYIHKNIYLYSKKNLNRAKLLRKVKEIDPHLIVVSGWMDSEYLYITKQFSLLKVPIVCAMDTKWHGHFKQWIFILICKLGWRKRHYSHAWVPGIFQYVYAKKMGFKTHEILLDLYSCDSNNFQLNPNHLAGSRKKRFLYAGRIAKEKNIIFLINVWKSLGEFVNEWELLIIGGSGQEFQLSELNNIKFINACSPKDLSIYMRESICFVIPSICEPWGVVIHEAASSGMILLTADNAGASSTFLINGHNGYLFNPLNSDSLRDCLLRIVNTPDNELLTMGQRSEELARRISPTSAAANLLSALI